jgi:cation:H+ antiporter
MISPLVFDRKANGVDTIVMIGATAAMVVAILFGLLPRWGGFAMVIAIFFYILYQYKAHKLEVEDVGEDAEGATLPGLMLIVGIVTLLVGSEILVQGAVAGGVALGVPEAVIGMTMIAFGTSLPELTACVAAARKNHSDMIIGGIVGSNIFNILSVMAFSAIAKPLVIDSRFIAFDMPVVVAVTILFAVFLLFVGRIGRVTGAVMAIGYLSFLGAQFLL